MREPSGELFELDFYFGPRDRIMAFRQVVDLCCAAGGSLTGEVLVSEGPNLAHRRFASIYADPVRGIRTNASELQRLFSDEDCDVVKVAMLGATGLSKDRPEIVTYSGVSSEAACSDNPAIAIVGEGWEFSTPGFERKAKTLGLRCYRKLLEICDALDPVYAAILNEDSLPCLYDLKRGQGTRCYRNFFVSSSAFGPSVLATIRSQCRNAYVEDRKNGLYVSTSSVYNPRSLGLASSEEASLAAGVAETLARGK
jgi:hypothetical protein